VLGGVTGVGRGNPVTGESAHNFGAISAPPHISTSAHKGSDAMVSDLQRTPEQVREHYEIEKALAARLRAGTYHVWLRRAALGPSRTIPEYRSGYGRPHGVKPS
jgi:hypothetical protein